ncbi:DNA repair protein RAD50 [Fasciola hepatica]|uniref:DNA repair protein RAD50 n=1 Tax=Fasciola hepatica TaxID=6192 RepID=A0A4E0RTY4_FASHE|nr:DNA repair protein RAD50 [Fasciola hepatica]
MVSCLGVSKAVLENVIFCHQEDSNWPLQEAKAVKQRFDDLFASSRYVKALDAMRKCKQDKDATVKIYKTELKHLGKSRDEALRLRSEREEMQRAIDREKEKIKKVDDILDPIVTKLNLYKRKYAELIQLQADVKAYESEKTHLEDSIANLMININNEFEGSSEQLAIMVDDAEAELEKKQHRLRTLEESMQSNRNQLRSCESERTNLMVEQGKLEADVKRLNEAVANRDALLRSAAMQFHLPTGDSLENQTGLSPSVVGNVQQLLKKLMQNKESTFQQVKSSTEAADRKAQSLLDSARDEVVRLKQMVDATRKSLRENDAELTRVMGQIEKAKTTTAKLDAIRMEVASAEAVMDELNRSTELSDARDRLAQLITERQENDRALNTVDEKIATYQLTMDKRREIQNFRKDRQTKLETARKLRSRHLEALEQVFGDSTSVPSVLTEAAIEAELTRSQDRMRFSTLHQSDRLRAAFITRLNSLDQTVRETRKRLAKAENDKSVLETSSKYTRSQLQDKQQKVRQMEERILSIAGSSDLEQILTRLQQRRQILEEECANEQGSLYLWRKFRDRIARVDADCPVCHRCLSDQMEQEELLAELDQRISSMPQESERKKRELTELVQQHERLLQLRPTSEELERIKTTELPELEAKLERELESLRTARDQSEEESARLETVQADESLAKSIQGDMAVLERMENEVFDLSRKIRQAQSADSDVARADDSEESLESMQQERRDLRTKQQAAAEEIEKCQQTVDRLDKNQRSKLQHLHQLKDAMHKLEQENASNIRLQHEITRLTETAERLRATLQTVENGQLLVAEQRRAEVSSERERVSRDREQQVEAANLELTRVRDIMQQVDCACDSVNRLQDRGSQGKLDLLGDQLKKVQEQVIHCQSLLDTFGIQMEQAAKDLNEHKIRQRELADCVQLRQLRAQLSHLKARVTQLNDQLRACHTVAGEDQDLIKETKRLEVEEEKIQAQKNVINSQICQLSAKLQYLDRDLTEKYATADKEYLDMLYQLKTTELGCSDLDRYYRALDRAILDYHESKMADLNKIIRELWRKTYRGNDIDYIEICSEAEAAGSGTAVSNAGRARRTYNYRVVMVKTIGSSAVVPNVGSRSKRPDYFEARLDMRGRCSAGQKVLASLIIRLALAEVFCLHCGVLALDEPTTNLDRDNICSLAEALVE